MAKLWTGHHVMHAGIFEVNNSNAFASKMQVDVIASKLDILLAMNERLPCSVHDHLTFQNLWMSK